MRVYTVEFNHSLKDSKFNYVGTDSLRFSFSEGMVLTNTLSDGILIMQIRLILKFLVTLTIKLVLKL